MTQILGKEKKEINLNYKQMVVSSANVHRERDMYEYEIIMRCGVR